MGSEMCIRDSFWTSVIISSKEASFEDMITEVQKYVPGYIMLNTPLFNGNKVTITVQVEGLGDFLPKYSGNLDIMTAAGLRTAEMLAQQSM